MTGSGSVPSERLGFLTDGQQLGGTLNVNRSFLPNSGNMCRVVSMIDGSGTFDTITGTMGFNIVEDAQGVRIDWP